MTRGKGKREKVLNRQRIKGEREMIGTLNKYYDTDGNGRMRVGDKEGGKENRKKIGVNEIESELKEMGRIEDKEEWKVRQ